MSTGAGSTGFDPRAKIFVVKHGARPILIPMKTPRSFSPLKSPKNSTVDPSEKWLKNTVLFCLAGLVAVFLFSFAPGKKSAPPPTAASGSARGETKAQTASFDRQSLSTKSR